jgi:hypothetical protein
MSDNERVFKEVMEQLSSLSLEDQVEILANVITFLGASRLKDAPEHIDPTNIAEIVLQDRKSNGETLANALALQGITMLMWLEQ